MVAPEANRVEYVGGPLDATTGELDNLPEEIAGPTGRYVRSVRCADDGAMRYVWRPSPPTAPPRRAAMRGDRHG